MEPCPEGTDATCPMYASDGPFRYALETAGRPPAAHRPCRSVPDRRADTTAVGASRRVDAIGVAGRV